MTTPAQQLKGMNLRDGWKVLEAVPVSPGQTGGVFSQGYVAESREGQRAYLKALDYTKAMASDDPAIVLQAMTEAFNFERDLLRKCRGLDRIVRAIADGTVVVSEQPVQYLIFELAKGDVRSQANISKRFDLAWSLRALHHVATGLHQLHGQNIAHNDLKPSNVLVFDNNISKVADLGRAAYKGHYPPHENLEIAGDPAYAPPELHYGYIDPDWNRRRLGCDAYLMGSMVAFFFSGVGMTALLYQELHEGHVWHSWTGSYGEVLPYIRDAFGRAIDSLRQEVPAEVREDVVAVVRELCEVDPKLRGHPANRTGVTNQYSLERYVSKFDLLARRAELGLLGP